jgi:FkbH-like protein
VYLEAARAHEVPPGDLCLKLARCHAELGDRAEALGWLTAVTRAEDSFLAWQGAAGLLSELAAESQAAAKRTARIGLLGSYTTDQFGPMLQLACAAVGIGVELYAGGYDQYRQEILDPGSGLHGFAPSHVVLAVHEGAAELPELSDEPDQAVEREASRWQGLWARIVAAGAKPVQHSFAVRDDPALGHLAARLPGSRHAMLHALNAELGRAAGDEVALVDCDRLAAAWGKARWFDDRYWFLAKQAVSLQALPLLARHTAAVIAADLGLARKCLVLDLDNTLWGGVVGEDGVADVRLGDGPEGEAYVAFQERILELKRKGIVLAVCSKNDDADARSVFEQRPEMRISLDDVACFAANWETKVDNIRWVAETLDLGLDALVYADDNPAEREIVRRFLPEVDVLPLPPDPARYARALSDYLHFETSTLSPEDAARAEHYRARGQAAARRLELGDLGDFLRDLEMSARIAPFDEQRLPRVVQLIGKTNQFNLTTRRHGLQKVRELTEASGSIHLYLELRDRFADHGLVGVLIATRAGEAMEIDTWLLSCRVIGRTAEHAMLEQLALRAAGQGCTLLRGTYAPTAKNGLVADLYRSLGFELVGEHDGETAWEYDLGAKGVPVNEFIAVEAVGA